MGQERPSYKLIRSSPPELGASDVTVYTTEFGLRVQRTNACHTQAVEWVGDFTHTGAKDTAFSKATREI